MRMNVEIEVNNVKEDTKPGYLVARDVDGALWYYGNFGADKERAESCATELGNGIVFKYEGQISE